MHPTLISQVSHDEIIERVDSARRERLARLAAPSVGAGDSRLRRALHRVRTGFLTWRMRNQLGAMPAPACVDCRGAA
jgi:hypothetical protein